MAQADTPFNDEQREWLGNFTDLLGEKMAAFARRLDETLLEDRRNLYKMNRVYIQTLQKIAEDLAALIMALEEKDVLAVEDIEGARELIKAGLAVDKALDPEFAEQARQLDRMTRELEQELGIEPERPEEDDEGVSAS